MLEPLPGGLDPGGRDRRRNGSRNQRRGGRQPGSRRCRRRASRPQRGESEQSGGRKKRFPKSHGLSAFPPLCGFTTGCSRRELAAISYQTSPLTSHLSPLTSAVTCHPSPVTLVRLSSARLRVFDCHIHVQPWRDMTPAARAVMTQGGRDTERVNRALDDPDELLRLLDEEGVERAALINYSAPEVIGFTASVNEWVSRYVARPRGPARRGRLRPPARVARRRRARGAALRGARHPDAQDPPAAPALRGQRRTATATRRSAGSTRRRNGSAGP